MTDVQHGIPEAPEAPAKPEPSDIYEETHTMSSSYNAVSKLDRDAQYRVLAWLSDRLSADARVYPDEGQF